MKNRLLASKPYLAEFLCFLVGVALTALVAANLHMQTATDPMAGYVIEYANLLDKVELPPDSDSELASYVWGVSGTMVGLAGMQYDYMSPSGRDMLRRHVARIDKLAPQFANVPFEHHWSLYSEEQSIAIRACILAAGTDDNAEVGTCVREIVGDALNLDAPPPTLAAR